MLSMWHFVRLRKLWCTIPVTIQLHNIVDLGYPVLDALVFLLPKSSNFIVLQEGDILFRSPFVALPVIIQWHCYIWCTLPVIIQLHSYIWCTLPVIIQLHSYIWCTLPVIIQWHCYIWIVFSTVRNIIPITYQRVILPFVLHKQAE
jgi:hypothetical protein